MCGNSMCRIHLIAVVLAYPEVRGVFAIGLNIIQELDG
jgi:hypothetical protein